MQTKTDIEIQEAAALKAVRAAIRLKYSLMADAEIYRVLPQVEARIKAALAAGEPLSIDPATYWTEASE